MSQQRRGGPETASASRRLGGLSQPTLSRRRSRTLHRVRLTIAPLLPVVAASAAWSSGAPAVLIASLTGASLAAALVLVGMWGRLLGPGSARLEVAVDTGVALLVTALVLASAEHPGWLVLALPVLEAGLRLGRVGGLVTWLAVSVGLVVAQLGVSRVNDEIEFESMAVAVRLAVLAAVAWIGHGLATELGREAALAQRARAEADRRARLLALVADTGRQLHTLDEGHIVDTVCRSARQLGAESVVLARRLPDAWLIEERRPLHPEAEASERLARAVAAGTAATGRTWWATASRVDAALGDELEVSGDLVGLPVEGLGALVVGFGRRRPPTLAIEALEMIVDQAAVVLGHVRALDEAASLRDELAHRAFHDDLTGLPNRSRFDEELRSGLARSARGGLAVLFCDLDGFKAVNDTLGHEAGDTLLEAAAQRLRNAVRPGDVVARMGGDEFTIIMEPAESAEAARALARRVREVLVEPFSLDSRVCRVGVSIGVAWTVDSGVDPDELVARADEAMYRAKRGEGEGIAVDDFAYQQLPLAVDLGRAIGPLLEPVDRDDSVGESRR